MRQGKKTNGNDGRSDQQDPEERVIDEFMGENPRARHLVDLCSALQARIRGLTDDLARSGEQHRPQLLSRINEARQQLGVLRQELAITQFVEEGVRATLRDQRPRLPDEFEEEE